MRGNRRYLFAILAALGILVSQFSPQSALAAVGAIKPQVVAPTSTPVATQDIPEAKSQLVKLAGFDPSTITAKPAAVTNSASPVVSFDTVTLTPKGSNGAPIFNPGKSSASNSLMFVSTGTWVGATNSFTYQWVRCDGAALAATSIQDGCTEIVGATSATYRVTEADVNSRLAAAVTARDAQNVSLTQYSATFAQRVFSAPANTSAPTISGTAAVGSVLTGDAGVWAGTENSYSYQYYVCPAAKEAAATEPTGCTKLGVSGTSITLTKDMFGQYVVLKISASNPATGLTLTSHYSASTEKVAAAPFLLTAGPTVGPAAGSSLGFDQGPKVSSKTEDSTLLSLTNGTWSGSATITYEYAWYSCELAKPASESLGGGCEIIDGATANTYRVSDFLVGRTILGKVTATNSLGSVTTYSASTAAVTRIPEVTDAGVIESDVETFVGNTITAGPATWLGSGNLKIGLQWFACPAKSNAGTVMPANCALVAGGTAATFKLTATQAGKYMVMRESATNSATGTSAPRYHYSASTNMVVAVPKVSANPLGTGSTVKFVSGSSTTLNTKFVVTPAGFGGSTAKYNFGWFRCPTQVEIAKSEAPEGCDPIPGAVAQYYTVTAADVGHYVVPQISASTGVSVTIPTLQIVNQTPSSAVSPVIVSDTPEKYGFALGHVLHVDEGTWGGSPAPRFGYQWYSCTKAVVAATKASTLCTVIKNAKSDSFTVSKTYLNKYLMVQLTATNSIISPALVTKFSASTKVILNEPANSVPPQAKADIATKSVSGAAVVGGGITAIAGVWTGTPLPTKTYQWYSCEEAVTAVSLGLPETCEAIAGATSLKFSPTMAQYEKYLSIAETATSKAGTSTRWSLALLPVEAKPVFATQPSIDGEALTGSELTPNGDGTENIPVDAITYQWLSCKAALPSVLDATPSTCTPISKATGDVYTVLAADENKYVAVLVKLTNDAGSVSKVSRSTLKVVGAPNANLGTVTAPTFTGTNLLPGVQLTAKEGTWTGSPAPTFTYQWLRCEGVAPIASSEDPGNCAVIENATASTYTLTVDDVHKYIRVYVTGANEHGDQSVWSAAPAQDVKQIPVFKSEPKLNSNRLLNQFLNLDLLDVASYPTAQPTYTWYRCKTQVLSAGSSIPTGCDPISGATSSDYKLVALDKNKYVLLSVKMTNSVGTVTRFTASTIEILEAPSFNGRPTYSGTAWEGGLLTGVVPPAVGSPTITVTYGWYWCSVQFADVRNQLPEGCYPADAEPGLSYSPVLADVGAYYTFGARAVSIYGSAEIYAPTTQSIKERPSVVRSVRLATDAPVVGVPGRPVTAGQWSGSTPINLSYQWLACTAEQLTATSIPPAGCVEILNATSMAFTPSAAQVTKFLVVRERAANGTVPVDRYSASSIAVSSMPTYTLNSGIAARVRAGDAAKNGSPRDGSVLEAVTGTWTGWPTPEFSYQWYQCEILPTPNLEVAGPPVDCGKIPLATRSTYLVTESDEGYTLRVEVKAQNTAGITSMVSAATGKVQVAPKAVFDPAVTGYRYIDAVLGASRGTFRGTAPLSYSQSWWLCEREVVNAVETQPSGCQQLTGANANLRVEAAWRDKYISAATTVLNDAGTLTVWSRSTQAIVPGAIATVAPSIVVEGSNPEPAAGGYVQVNRGTWVGDPLPAEGSYTYQWYVCENQVPGSSFTLDADTYNCVSQQGETSWRYQLQRADHRKYAVVAVTAFNIHGGSTIYSAPSAQVLLAPESSSAASVSGRAFNQELLTSMRGSWYGFNDPVITFQWMACDELYEYEATMDNPPIGCAEIPGATASSYKLTENELGKYVMLRETATNRAGVSQSWSMTTEIVQSGPVNKVAPAIAIANALNGYAVVGRSNFTTTGGTWLGSPTPVLTFEWYLCEKQVAASSTKAPLAASVCAVIPNQTASSYTPVASDRGKYTLVHVTAENEFGTADLWSPTSAVVNMAPELDASPVVGGNPFLLGTVRAKLDTWTAYPEVTRTYTWQVCQSAEAVNCTTIAGATSERFTIPDTATFENKFLVAKVTATNVVGSSTATTSPTPAIVRGPVNTSDPVVSGVAQYPSTGVLTVSDGRWVGTPLPSISYQWYRCLTKEAYAGLTPVAVVPAASDELDPKVCTEIVGATESSYAITDADPSYSLMAGVTGTNALGSSTRFTRSTLQVTERLSLVKAPSITSPPLVDTEMETDEGIWRGFPRPQFVAQWYECTSQVPTTGNAKPGVCEKIVGANGPTFTPDYDENNPAVGQLGKFLVYSLVGSSTVNNVKTTITIFSASTLKVAKMPKLVSKPSIVTPGPTNDAFPLIDDRLTVTAVWESTGTNDKVNAAYQWFRCETQIATGNEAIVELPEGCTEIEGATDLIYTVAVADRAKFLIVQVSGSNSAGDVSRWSNSTRAVQTVPIALPGFLPTVSGDRLSGATLTVDEGTWDPSDVTFEYKWLNCSVPVPVTVNKIPLGCNAIGTATEKTFVQPATDPKVPSWFTVQVTGVAGELKTSYFVAAEADKITAAKPEATTKPTIKAPARAAVGEVFEIVPGVWVAVPSYTLSYQWYGCEIAVPLASNTLDPSCAEIEGATSSTYAPTLEFARLSKYLLAGVKASNAAGFSVEYTKAFNSKITATWINTTPLSVSASSLTVPTTLTPSLGTWDITLNAGEAVKHDYYWVLCESPITSVQSSTPNGCSFEDSTELQTGAPLNIGVGSVFAGRYISLAEDVSLRAANSSKWIRERTRVSVSTGFIREAPGLWKTSPNYAEPTVPQYLLVEEQATPTVNQWLDTAVVPISSVTWRGAELGSLSYQWFSCTDRSSRLSESGIPATCENVAGATSKNYTPTIADLGRFMGLQITAKNSLGSFSVWTATSVRGVTEAPNYTTAPTLNKLDIVGETLSLDVGVWRGTAPMTMAIAWYSCSQSSPNDVVVKNVDPTTPTNCTTIDGARDPDKLLTIDMADRYIMASISMQNEPRAAGVKEKIVFYTKSTLLIRVKPSFSTLPTQSSPWIADVEETVTLNRGSHISYKAAPVGVSYRWWACAPRVAGALSTPIPFSDQETPAANCELIPSATQANLLLKPSARDNANNRDTVIVGNYVVGQVVLKNTAGTAYATVSSNTVVMQPPVNTSAPKIAGVDMIGETITATAGAWSGSPDPNPSLTYAWYACNQALTTPLAIAPDVCTVIPGATGKTYQITDALRGSKHLMVVETARNTTNKKSHTVTMTSATIGPIRYAPTYAGQSITMVGAAHFGSTLVANGVAPDAVPQATLNFDWYACDTAVTTVATSVNGLPADCAVIAGSHNATSQLLTDAQVGKRIAIFASGDNGLGVAAVSSLTTAAVTKSPSMVDAPVLTGRDYYDSLPGAQNYIDVSNGTWSSWPAADAEHATYSYLWYTCTSANPTVVGTKPLSCTETTTTTSRLAITAAMKDKHIVASVTVTVAGILPANVNTATKFTKSIGPIRIAPAFGAAAPTITGYAHVGERLTAVAPTSGVTGTPTPTANYDWYICNAAISSVASMPAATCGASPVATGGTFTVPSLAAGKFIAILMTASNGVLPNATKSSVTTLAVSQTPVNDVAPVITGSNVISGAALSVSKGTWTSSPNAGNATYTWYSCPLAVPAQLSVLPGTCSLIANATANTFTPSAALKGAHIVSMVTYTVTGTVNKPGGGISSVSAASVGPMNLAASFTTSPSISGTATVHVDSQMTANPGATNGFPAPTTTYKWYACVTAPSSTTALSPDCALIDAGDTLTVPSSAYGKYIAAAFTATNGVGADALYVATSSVKVTQTPTNTAAPVITGDALVGATALSLSNGTWTPALGNIEYSWYSCIRSVPAASFIAANCLPIDGANAKTLTLTNDLAGKHVFGYVTYTLSSNKPGAGSAKYGSASVGPIEAAPVFSAAPTIAGDLHVDSTLTARLSTVTAYPTDVLTTSYEWYICNSTQSTVSLVLSGCGRVPDNTSASFRLPASAAGKYIYLVATASNGVGEDAVAKSATGLAVSSTPEVAIAPVITGSAQVGSPDLAVSTGTWASNPAVPTNGYTYAWYACTLEFAGGKTLPATGCAVVSGESAKTLRLTSALMGKHIISQVSATASVNKLNAGVGTYYTASLGPVVMAPENTSLPNMTVNTATLANASVVTAGSGTWKGTGSISYRYSWYRCEATFTVAATGLNAAPSSPPCTFIVSDRNTYTATSTDVGKKLLLLVTATNSYGSTIKSSVLTAIVK